VVILTANPWKTLFVIQRRLCKKLGILWVLFKIENVSVVDGLVIVASVARFDLLREISMACLIEGIKCV